MSQSFFFFFFLIKISFYFRVQITVWDHDSFGRNQFLGEALIQVSNIRANEISNKWVELESLSYGEIYVQIKYTSATDYLSISVIRARGLNGGRKVVDPYAKVFLNFHFSFSFLFCLFFKKKIHFLIQISRLIYFLIKGNKQKKRLKLLNKLMILNLMKHLITSLLKSIIQKQDIFKLQLLTLVLLEDTKLLALFQY